uniref:Uncharacterized protein n=1 Tax=Rhizophora mucronata TaxID=61149 RepID=A0A2P2QBQ6_RHIMU
MIACVLHILICDTIFILLSR